MQKVEAKTIEESERREFVLMKEQIWGLRRQAGHLAEQALEIEAQIEQTHRTIQTVKKNFRERMDGLAKSYGLELGVHRDGVMWQFNEDDLVFVPTVVPNTLPVVAAPMPPVQLDRSSKRKHGRIR